MIVATRKQLTASNKTERAISRLLREDDPETEPQPGQGIQT
jgi:hypothetical protein